MASRTIIVVWLVALAFAPFRLAEAQQAKKVPRIAFLLGAPASSYSARIDVFKQALKKLGYVEGKNIAIEYRYAEGEADRLPALAAELVGLKVDVILATVTPSVLAVKKVSATIPIVLVGVSDPVASGLVASLARPGGNITGLTILAPELSGKRLELLSKPYPRGISMEFRQSRSSTTVEGGPGRSTATTPPASISRSAKFQRF
jgi:putative tryptophan/tyrosine transport system substrate-binding protein